MTDYPMLAAAAASTINGWVFLAASVAVLGCCLVFAVEDSAPVPDDRRAPEPERPPARPGAPVLEEDDEGSLAPVIVLRPRDPARTNRGPGRAGGPARPTGRRHA